MSHLASAFDLETTYLALDGSGRAASLLAGPDFWRTVDDNPDVRGALVTVGTGDGDWGHWEMHPAGDEVLVLLEGRLKVIFERGDREDVHAMAPGATLIVPAGVWNRAVKLESMRMLFVTYGAGARHKPARV